MRKKLTQSSLRNLALLQVRHVEPVRYGGARDGVAQVYQELERDFGILAPPVALHSPAYEPLAASWLMLRETLLVPGLASRAEKEAVATAVSTTNECPFCVRMHSATLSSLLPGRSPSATEDDPVRPASITDPAVSALADWAKENSVRDPADRHPAPFPAEQTPEMVGVAVLLHYYNRMVNLFLGEAPLPPGAPLKSLGAVMRILMWLIGSAVRTEPAPGVSLDLLPSAPLPEDLAWAAGNPVIAEAFARAAAAVEEAGHRSVPESVRELLHAELTAWDGRPRGISRAWVEDGTAALPPQDRAAGRLALLTAMASYQVDDTAIARFREGNPADGALIDLTAWASLTASRRIGTWLARDAMPQEAGEAPGGVR